MEVMAELELRLKSKELAKAMLSSITPDNVSIPESLKLDMHLTGKALTVSVYTASRPDTLISTIDDILKSCQLVLESIASMSDQIC